MVGTDVLGDATGFTGNHIGFANGIKQGGFAMVHVTHYGNYRRAWFEILLVVFGI